MSYEVTATRRRPQRFDDLVGQEFVAETLKKSITSGKIAHAYLFSGPRGCGKTSTARILAKALNCAEGPTENPCGKCSNCQEITKGSSLDVIEIDGASNTSVENIRQIKDEVLFPPSNSRYKIYIIDEVHMLSTSAFNALLKTIEEPPPYVIFIFATTELQKVPATIKSRCQQFNFRLVSIEKVKECLAQAAAELNVQADDEALFWIARESTGSMRDAYTLFDQVVAFSDGHMTYEKIKDKLGLVGIDRLNTAFEACANGQTEQIINLLDEFLQVGVSIEQLISNSADYLRSLLLIKSGVTKESLLGNSKERFSSVVLEKWNSVQIERALSIFLQLYRDIRYSLSPRYELELAFSRLCWLSQYVSNAEVKKAIDAAQALLSGAGGGNTGGNSGTSSVSGRFSSGGVQTGNGQPQVMQQAAAFQSSQANQMNQMGQTSQVNQMNQPQANLQTGFESQQAQTSQVSQQAWQSQSPEVQQQKPQSVVQGIPNGLPRLSMLDNYTESDAASSGSDAAQGDEANPFHNGGPLPPQQPVAAYVQSQNDTYTENPDDEADDGWTNTDTPPEGDFYTEEDYAQRAEESYEAVQNQEEVVLHPVQSDEKVSLADGTVISVAQLRENVTSSLAVSDSFTAPALEKTGKWEVKGDVIETTVENDYDFGLLKQKLPVINNAISVVLGKPAQLKISVVSKKTDENAAPAEIPVQVKILVDMFKGTIVAGRK